VRDDNAYSSAHTGINQLNRTTHQQATSDKTCLWVAAVQ
jgi:hypothetical protein